MRALILVSVSAGILAACSSTQKNPIYQQSSGYQTGTTATQQYASAPTTQTAVTQAVYSGDTYSQDAYTQQTYPADSYSHDAYTTNAGDVSTDAYPVYAHRLPFTVESDTSVVAQNEFTYETAPGYEAPAANVTPAATDYVSEDITGTPGYMVMQGQSETVTTYDAVPALPPVQSASSPVYGSTVTHNGAGTPVAYDISRNLITADALTTGQQPSETIRHLQGSTGQGYLVQPGDTVYSLSRRTCVGVNVIQSMNGLSADYGIKIGQSLTLPSPVC